LFAKETNRDKIELERLREAVQELSILNDIATAVSGLWELDQVVDLIVHKCVKNLNVEQGAIMLLDDETSDKPFQTMIRKIDKSESKVPYHFGIQLSGWMLQNKKSLLVNDFQSDNRFKIFGKMDFSIKSLLSVPLNVKGRMIGCLNLFNKRTETGFTQNDQRILSIIAAQSAQVIESTRLYKKEKELRSLEEDLLVAHEIQNQLLPKELPQIDGYDIAGLSISAKEVGGDYYDFIPINDDHLAFCLGDISGKGIPASLLMANLQATLRGQAFSTFSCSEVLRKSNTFLYHSTDIQKFATLFYAVLNTKTNELTYSIAGHTPPMYLPDNGKLIKLDVGGTVLGFLEHTNYEEDKMIMQPGDLLVIHSDGITEAGDHEVEDYDEWRLEKAIEKHKNKSSQQIIDEIIKEVRTFTMGFQQDDMTLIVIKRKK